jgi:hypothetical protein
LRLRPADHPLDRARPEVRVDCGTANSLTEAAAGRLRSRADELLADRSRGPCQLCPPVGLGFGLGHFGHDDIDDMRETGGKSFDLAIEGIDL